MPSKCSSSSCDASSGPPSPLRWTAISPGHWRICRAAPPWTRSKKPGGPMVRQRAHTHFGRVRRTKDTWLTPRGVHTMGAPCAIRSVAKRATHAPAGGTCTGERRARLCTCQPRQHPGIVFFLTRRDRRRTEAGWCRERARPPSPHSRIPPSSCSHPLILALVQALSTATVDALSTAQQVDGFGGGTKSKRSVPPARIQRLRLEPEHRGEARWGAGSFSTTTSRGSQ